MNWQQFRVALASQHFGQSQNLAKIDRALALARDALETLSALGHPFHLAEGSHPKDARSDWPRVMFNLAVAPNGRVIDGPTEYSSLGPNWFDTLEEAQHAEGVQQSMTGRSGAPRPSGLPAPTESPLSGEARVEARRLSNSKTRATIVKAHKEKKESEK